jgi:hypothetical protein
MFRMNHAHGADNSSQWQVGVERLLLRRGARVRVVVHSFKTDCFVGF